jgi:PAS domain S-box-containing protein
MKIKIFYKLMLGFLAVIFFVYLVAFHALTTGQEKLRERIGKSSSLIALQTLQEIDRNIYNRIEYMQTLCHSIEMSDAMTHSNNSFKQLEDIEFYIDRQDQQWSSWIESPAETPLSDLLSNPLSHQFREVMEYFEHTYGYRVFAEIFATNKYGANIAQSGLTTDYKQNDERWWQAAQQQGVYVSDVEFDKSAKVYSLDLGLRVVDEKGRFIGVVKVVLNIEEVLQCIHRTEGLRDFSSTEMKLVGRDGRVIYSPDGQILDERTPVETLEQMSGNLGHFESEETLLAYARSPGYRDFKGLGWRLIIETPSRDIFESVAEIKRTVIWISLILIPLALLIGGGISSRISKSLKALQVAAARIGRGDLSIDIQAPSNDEVGELADSFSQMVRSLKNHVTSIHKLNNEVRARNVAEEQLRVSQDRLKLAIQGTSDGLWDWDINTNKVWYAKRFKEMLGYNDEEFPNLFESWETRLHPDDKDATLAAVKAHLEEKQPYDVDYRLETKPGPYRWFRARGKAVRDQGENPVRMSGSIQDITDTKQAESELQRTLQELDLQKFALDQHAIVAITDSRGRISYVNDKFCDISKYSAEELLGQDHRIINSGYHPKEFFQDLWATIRRGDVWKGEIRNRDKMGEIYWVNTTIVPFKDSQGTATQFVAIREDITALKKAEEETKRLISELSDKNAELERFTYTVSHDLKSPLITVKGFLGMLEKDLEAGDSDRLKSDMDSITRAADKMHQLLNEVLELSRIGRVANPTEDIDLTDMAQEVVQLLSGTIEKHQAHVRIADNLPVVYGDRVRLREVLQNLIENALKYSSGEDTTQIEIGYRQEQGDIVYTVRDNGIGIDPRYHEKIFDLFDQLDQSQDGSGVGLALVKRILQVHGGRIWVESEGIGHGSTFCFTLPQVKETHCA